jgi:patatin-like phospholipase/acyl hydrolase
MAYRILSLDGGGIRGLLTIRIIERLNEEYPAFMDNIDLIAGTSTGGILALCLAAGLSPKHVREMYQDLGERVFNDGPINLAIEKAVKADYTSDTLREIVKQVLGDINLGELKKKVLISAFDLDNETIKPGNPRTWKAKFFHNFDPDDPDYVEKVVDIAARTSAAPTYFPIYQGYIDGGVVANNPTMCAVAQALEPKMGKQKLTDLAVLSLGTGSNPTFLSETDGSWGLIKWAPHLIGLMMDGAVNLADYQCKQLLGKRYLRLNPIMQKSVGLDDVKSVSFLLQLADLEPLDAHVRWLKRNFKAPKTEAGN